MSDGVEVQINEDEPGEIELIIVDNCSHLAAFFTLKEWENFKKQVNEFKCTKKEALH